MQDSRLFMGFMTLVVAFMFVSTLVSTPRLLQPWPLVAFTLLLILHLALHWLLGIIAARPTLVAGYIVVQGLLAFLIVWLSNNVGMIFALYMGLIGEAVGLLKLTRRGLLAIVYYLLLSMILYEKIVGIASLGWWALGTAPVVIFVVIYVTLYMRQALAREQAQELLQELEAANQQLSEYAARVEDLTIANERQRMARELHDTLSQGLAGLILQLEAVDAHLAQDRPARAREIVQQTLERARSTLADARRVISDLRTGQLEPQSIEEALAEEVDRFQHATGLACELDVQTRDNLPEPLAETLQRIVAEALTNILRHAQASRASVRVWSEAGALHARIQDDGRGFDPSEVDAGHYGLLGMRERTRLAGGTLTVEGQAGQGTLVELVLPLERDNG